MKNSIALLLTGILLAGTVLGQTNSDLPKSNIVKGSEPENGTINALLDLTNVIDDKVPVTINPERFTKDTVTYRLPKVIPGTYRISDFGSFVEEFKAYNYEGEEMDFIQSDENSWVIPNATTLDKISYWVNDTFDIENVEGVATPFSPSGTNIAEDNFVLNLPGFIGYFDSFEQNQYKLNVSAKTSFNSSSALQKIGVEFSKDSLIRTVKYYASRYFDVTDNPMMYGDFEVEEFQVGEIKVVLSVYSPNKVYTAKDLKETIYQMMESQKAYLGDINSTSRYDIFLYLSAMNETSPTGFGALEHHTSTVVVLPESMPLEALASSLVDVVSHEFFHILTPLSIHSEDVHYFNYHDPTFSKHLWMYEGVTEYFATLFQVDQGLVTEEEFYNTIMSKIQAASGLDDTMSFTVMSENVLVSPYAENYFNVYQKGALIGMCIDIILREESNGERGILSLMKELSHKFGKNKPFKDDLLIEEIVKMTYPFIGDFFESHVVGTTPIDYKEYFDKVGLEITESMVETNYIQNNGTLIVAPGREGTIVFTELVENNSFWNGQGVLPNDIIAEVNGTVVTMQNAQQVFSEVFSWQPGTDVEVKLVRGEEEIQIKTTLTQSYTKGETLQAKEDASEAQIKLRNAWLKG